jgi:hypothetical protein
LCPLLQRNDGLRHGERSDPGFRRPNDWRSISAGLDSFASLVMTASAARLKRNGAKRQKAREPQVRAPFESRQGKPYAA